MSALHNIKTPLKELNNMVGMENLKKNILDQLLYFIQDLHTKTKEGDFLHTVIYGKPGTGKTEVAKLIGQIYSKLGIINENIDWSILRPSDFSIEDKNLHLEFKEGIKLDDKQIEFKV